MRVVDAVGRAKDRLAANCIGRAQAWAPVLVIRVHGGCAVATVGPAAGKLQRTHIAGDGIGHGRVHEGEAILRFAEGRHDIPAQSGVHRQLGRQLEVVIHIQREGVVTRTGLLGDRRVLGVA